MQAIVDVCQVGRDDKADDEKGEKRKPTTFVNRGASPIDSGRDTPSLLGSPLCHEEPPGRGDSVSTPIMPRS